MSEMLRERPVTEEEKRDAAIRSAVDHANSDNLGWSTQALNFLCVYLSSVKGTAGDHFTCELVRLKAEAAGVPTPPDGRAWGGVFRGASSLGLIRFSGKITKNVGRHKGDAKLWTLP